MSNNENIMKNYLTEPENITQCRSSATICQLCWCICVHWNTREVNKQRQRKFLTASHIVIKNYADRLLKYGSAEAS